MGRGRGPRWGGAEGGLHAWGGEGTASLHAGREGVASMARCGQEGCRAGVAAVRIGGGDRVHMREERGCATGALWERGRRGWRCGRDDGRRG